MEATTSAETGFEAVDLEPLRPAARLYLAAIILAAFAEGLAKRDAELASANGRLRGERDDDPPRARGELSQQRVSQILGG